MDAAIDSYDQALKFKPDYAECFVNYHSILVQISDASCLNEKIEANTNNSLTLLLYENAQYQIQKSIQYFLQGDCKESKINLSNYKICLINSDFKFNNKIKRDNLFKYIINNTKLVCSYEPCIYPGVKIQYFYNNYNNGICDCEDYCENKNKNSKCTKITIAIFESGCTIITGAKNLEQINTTYQYIANLLTNNISQFKKKELPVL